MVDPDELLVHVEAHLLTAFGEDSGRAGVSFLGAERIDVLRFGPDPDGLVRYATLGMSRMTPNEAAWKRVHGAEALEERWLAAGADLRDPVRAEVSLA
ncbi:MAG: suppressor of fused domain protein [Actinobacteria bacterium]|nr:suppressor of fused domain protein [Actinomycetota bacterium]